MDSSFIVPDSRGMALIHGKYYNIFTKGNSATIVLSLPVVQKNYVSFRDILRDSTSVKSITAGVYYSMKTNAHPQVLQELKDLGCGIQVVSRHELSIALGIGFDGKDIILHGLGKDRELLEIALNNNIHVIYMDSLRELEILSDISTGSSNEEGMRPRIGLIFSRDSSSKIGFHSNEESVDLLIKKLRQLGRLDDIHALHLHPGTQISNIEEYSSCLEVLVRIARKIRETGGPVINCFNLGGGYPEATYLKEKQLESIFGHLTSILSRWGESTGINPRLDLEPGRYIVSDAGIVLCKVKQVKQPLETGQDPWLILSAGINVFNPIAKARSRYLIANRMNDSYRKTFNIAGPLPTNLDIFTKHYPLPDATTEGDDVIITNAGAYTLPFLMDFCVPPPKIHVIRDD
ncbi:MAG: diaminopimelate decarboxylase family protein [Promethearchaeota archaeon]